MGDAQGVLKQGDFEAIVAGIGKALAGAPTSSVMDVYYAMSTVVGGNFGLVPTNMFSLQNPLEAKAAYTALMQFKDTVKAAQPEESGTSAPSGSSGEFSQFTVSVLIVTLLATLPN